MVEVSSEANESEKDVEITGADALADGNMMELKVGEAKSDKVLITRY